MTLFLWVAFIPQLTGALATSIYWNISYLKIPLNYFPFSLTPLVLYSDFKVWSQHTHKNCIDQLVKYAIMNTNFF